MLIEDLEFFEKLINRRSKHLSTDRLKLCTDKDWYKNYPVQDFDYNFNSWGFRGPDYQQYVNSPVILCLGDSFTVNIGSPVEHSWPSLIQKHFDIPCLNLGMIAAGNDAIRLVYERACKIFDVQETFVVYSYLHRRLEDGVFTEHPHNHLDNVEYLKQQMISDCIYQFGPPWAYTLKEQAYLHDMVKPYLQTFWEEDIERSWVIEEDYNNMKGPDWPTYKKFINGAEPHSDITSGIFKLPLKHKFYTNRDGYHMSLDSNQRLAESLIEQWKQS